MFYLESHHCKAALKQTLKHAYRTLSLQERRNNTRLSSGYLEKYELPRINSNAITEGSLKSLHLNVSCILIVNF